MTNIVDVISFLKNTSSRNEKIEILKKYESTELTKVLKLALEPSHSFFCKKIPIVRGVASYDVNACVDVLFGVFGSDNRKQISDAINSVIMMCNTASDEHRDFWYSIIKQDIDCGIGASSVNAAYGPTISEYKLMKAEDRESLFELKLPVYVQQKVDASRCQVVAENGKVTIHSSSGTPYPNMNHIKESVSLVVAEEGYDNFVIDGELCMVDAKGNVLPRAISNGKANKALNGNLSLVEEASFELKAFDLIKLSKFREGYSPVPYHIRINELMHRFFGCAGIDIINTESVETFERVLELYEEAVQAGQEGIMVKERYMPYEGKRSKHMVKLKKEFEVDLIVVDTKPHKKNKDMIGSLVLASSDHKIVGSVGTKMSDDDRIELKKLLDSHQLIGKIVTTRIHDVSEKKVKGQMTYSLYLPRFIEVRNDKFVADSFERIMKIIHPVGA